MTGQFNGAFVIPLHIDGKEKTSKLKRIDSELTIGMNE